LQLVNPMTNDPRVHLRLIGPMVWPASRRFYTIGVFKPSWTRRACRLTTFLCPALWCAFRRVYDPSDPPCAFGKSAVDPGSCGEVWP
jgi:hypothetical protein